jgi:hypothetical protein
MNNTPPRAYGLDVTPRKSAMRALGELDDAIGVALMYLRAVDGSAEDLQELKDMRAKVAAMQTKLARGK